jgi:FkbM family methyltransferase
MTAPVTALKVLKNFVRPYVPRIIMNHREANYYARYGEVELHLLPYLCRPSLHSIDVGANCGEFVHFLRRYSAHTWALEPHPEFVAHLERRFDGDKRVDLLSVALSDQEGVCKLYVPIVNGHVVGGCSTLSRGAVDTYGEYRTVAIRSERLDDMEFVATRNIGFIKIDVEGHEQAVLDGGLATIERFRPNVLVEIDENLSPHGVSRAREFFDRLGYKGWYVHRYRLYPIDDFNVSLLQNPKNGFDLTAALDRRARAPDFINNFLFMPSDDAVAAIKSKLSELEKG